MRSLDKEHHYLSSNVTGGATPRHEATFYANAFWENLAGRGLPGNPR